MLISLLLLVPLTAMALVLGLGRLEDSLLGAPAVLTDDGSGDTVAADTVASDTVAATPAR